MTAEFKTEADLCAAFIASLPEEWTAYPETGGFDILLVRKEDGFQIGIEAKLKLNAKVICQIAEKTDEWSVCRAGPDCRAVLVPEKTGSDLARVCELIGVTVIRQYLDLDHAKKKRENKFWSYSTAFNPNLPKLKEHVSWSREWRELCPEKRCEVPDYVPDVNAGHSAPVQLTPWKIEAIKIAVTLDKRGFVTRRDFKHHGISMGRWTQGGWLFSQGDGRWTKGPRLPDFKAQHPVNYEQIAADYETWKCSEIAA